MIDIETMGSGPQAAIVAIGACYFDIETGEIEKTFECTINLTSSALYGDIDPETVKWWLNQSHEAQQEIVTASMSLYEGLKRLSHFVTSNADQPKIAVWANAPSFDCTILKSAYESCVGPDEAPWQFWNENCCRTIISLAELITGVNYKKNRPFKTGVKHSALADAMHQAGYVSDAYQALKNYQK